MSHQPFHDSPNVMHGDKGHLDIDLGKFWLTIRSEVFIPKTPDDLIVSIKSGNHQNLFKQLGRLREGIKMAGIESTGDQKISCPFRGAFSKHRGLNLQKSQKVKVISDLFCDL